MLIFATTEQGEGLNDVRIATGQGLSGQFPDGKLGRMIDAYMLEDLQYGDYTAAFQRILDPLSKEMLGEIENADPDEYDEPLTFGEWIELILIIIFPGLVCIIGLLYSFFRGNGGGGSGGDHGYSSYDSGSPSSGSSYGGGSSDGGGAGRNF